MWVSPERRHLLDPRERVIYQLKRLDDPSVSEIRRSLRNGIPLTVDEISEILLDLFDEGKIELVKDATQAFGRGRPTDRFRYVG